VENICISILFEKNYWSGKLQMKKNIYELNKQTWARLPFGWPGRVQLITNLPNNFGKYLARGG
jgi:hypothetical protein